MRMLMNKFRIAVSDVVVIPDITAPPSAATRAWFDFTIRNMICKDNDPAALNSGKGTNLIGNWLL